MLLVYFIDCLLYYIARAIEIRRACAKAHDFYCALALILLTAAGLVQEVILASALCSRVRIGFSFGGAWCDKEVAVEGGNEGKERGEA